MLGRAKQSKIEVVAPKEEEFGRVLDKLPITIIRSNCLCMHTG